MRERKWLSLEEAVHKVTGKPAAAFNLHDRGRIAPGYVADLVVFDPKAVHTDATYEKPDVVPMGFKSVLRNGNVLVDSGIVA